LQTQRHGVHMKQSGMNMTKRSASNLVTSIFRDAKGVFLLLHVTHHCIREPIREPIQEPIIVRK
jgi:hypothetical protein